MTQFISWMRPGPYCETVIDCHLHTFKIAQRTSAATVFRAQRSGLTVTKVSQYCSIRPSRVDVGTTLSHCYCFPRFGQQPDFRSLRKEIGFSKLRREVWKQSNFGVFVVVQSLKACEIRLNKDRVVRSILCRVNQNDLRA